MQRRGRDRRSFCFWRIAMEDLFSMSVKSLAPLADRMRPRTLDEFVGQEQIVGRNKLLRRAIEADRLTSSIFWGPPGCGKTTLARNCRKHARGIRQAQRRYQRRVRRARGAEGGGEPAEAERPADLSAAGRMPSLVEGTVGLHSPSDRAGRDSTIGLTTENPMIAMTPARAVAGCFILSR